MGFVAFSSNGHQIASAARDGSVKTWDMFAGVCLQTVASHLRTFKFLTYSPDGHSIILACSNAVKVWDLLEKEVRLMVDDELTYLVGAASSQGSQTVVARFANVADEREVVYSKIKAFEIVTGAIISTRIDKVRRDGSKLNHFMKDGSRVPLSLPMAYSAK